MRAAQTALSKLASYVPDGMPVIPDPDGDCQTSNLMFRISANPQHILAPGFSGHAHMRPSVQVETPGAP